MKAGGPGVHCFLIYFKDVSWATEIPSQQTENKRCMGWSRGVCVCVCGVE